MSFRHVYNRNKEQRRITERAHTGAHALARAYLDAARDLGVVEQPNSALDLLREGGDARTPESKHFHGSWFRIAKQKAPLVSERTVCRLRVAYVASGEEEREMSRYMTGRTIPLFFLSPSLPNARASLHQFNHISGISRHHL